MLGGANFLANRYNKSYDATANKQFTLSDQTIKIVKNLKQDVTHYVLGSAHRFQAAQDLLDRYKNLSPKIDVEYVDPIKNRRRRSAAGVKTRATIFVKVGEQARRSQELDRRRSHRRDGPRAEGRRAHGLLRRRARRASLDDTGSRRLLGSQGPDRKNNYKTKRINLLREAGSPGGLHHGGGRRARRSDYIQPEVDAIKNYVEDGGRALFMLDPPLKFAASRDRRQQRAGSLLDELGRDAGEGPGARYKRRRPAVRAGSGISAGDAVTNRSPSSAT